MVGAVGIDGGSAPLRISSAHLEKTIRWPCLEEERATIDREAIATLFRGAAGIKLEGRVIPIVRTRAEGMARCHQLEEQMHTWAHQVDTPVQPSLTCLVQLSIHSPAEIAMTLLSDGRASG